MPAHTLPASYRALQRELVSHRVIASVVFGAATLLTPQLVKAQQTGPVQVPPITVEGQRPPSGAGGDYKVDQLSSPKMTEPVLDTPQTINIVPKALIEERGATTLRDVLRNVPGISLQAAEGGVPLGDNLTLRGFAARTDIFLDGVRDFGNYFRDPFNYEAVEVLKGPSSALAGRGSTGGVINQVSKAPQKDAFVEGAFTYGTDATKRATADLNQPLTGLGLENAAFRLNILAHDQEVADRDALERQRWGFAPSVAFGLGTPTQVSLYYFHLAQDNVPDYGHFFFNGKPAEVDRSNFYGLKNRDHEESSADYATATIDHRFNDMFSVRNLTRYGWTSSDYIASQAVTPNFTAGTISRNSKSRDSEDTVLINQTDLTSKFATVGLDHTLVTGLEVSRETSDNRIRQNNVNGPVTSIFDPDFLQAGPGVPYTGAKTGGEADSMALYFFDSIKISPMWEVTGGLRWDYSDIEVTSIAANQTSTEFGRTDSDVSWRAGLIFKPVPTGSIYAAAGTSFNPSGERLALNANTQPVDPEENLTYEVGTKWDLFGSRLAVTGAVFRTEKTNARTQDPLGGTVQVLQGEQVINGFEIGVSGAITDKWRVYAGYTYLDGEITESNNPAQVGTEPVNVAPQTANLWTTYDLPWRLVAGFGAQYTDRRWAGNSEGSAAGTNSNRVPDSLVFDAMLTYHLTDKIDLRMNLLNLTDEEYYEGVYTSMVVPAPGRSVLFTVAARY
jgi:catecholate siderophore receptor